MLCQVWHVDQILADNGHFNLQGEIITPSSLYQKTMQKYYLVQLSTRKSMTHSKWSVEAHTKRLVTGSWTLNPDHLPSKCLMSTIPSSAKLGFLDFPDGSEGEESTSNGGDVGSIPGLGRYPGEGKGNTFQYSCLGNPMDKGSWQATVHGVTESDMTEHACMHNILDILWVRNGGKI